MALRDEIILKKGQAIVIAATSGVGIAASSSQYISGSIALVSDLSDIYDASDIVLFDTSKAISFSISGDSNLYYLTTEDNLQIKEA